MLALSVLAVPAMAADGMGAAGMGAAGAGKADFQSAARQRLMKADRDGDGKLSSQEWADTAKARGKDRFADRIFARFDGNKDGFLDMDEIDSLSARRFARLDADGDGQISADERSARREKLDD